MQIAVPNVLQPKEDDITKIIAANVHIGTTNTDYKMKQYVWKRRADGVNIINIGKTWEKLMLAARIITAIENPQDVVVICSRQAGQRAALKFSQYINCQCIAGRYTPGTFTNQITKQYREPRLVIVTDPRLDFQAIKEASYVNIPVIAICDTDASLKYVDCAVPGNNKTTHSIGLLFWFLAREVLRMRGAVKRDSWEVPVDLFFYREPSEVEKNDDTNAATYEEVAEGEAQLEGAAQSNWDGAPAEQSWEGAATTQAW